MATFNTVWSIDVGRSALKAVKLRRERNNIEILAVDKIDYTPGQNGVDFTSKAKEAIAAFRVRNDVKEPVIVAHNGQGTLSRFIKIPAFESKKVKEMVGYEASQQIPFPLDEVVWDYHVVDRDYLPGEEREVGLFAARRETIDDFLVDFTSENLSVEGLTIGYLGLINYVFYDINPQEPAIVLDIGGSHTDLILVDGHKFWIRALPHSGNEISKAIMDRLKLGFAEAEKLKVDIAKNPKQATKLFAAIVQPRLKELVNQIHQSVGFYRSQVGETQFKDLYLLGNASRIVGIKKFLEEHLRVRVHRVQTINHLRINRDVDVQILQSNLPAFGTAFGTALQGVGAGTCTVDLIPHEEKLEKEYHRKKVHVFLAIGILFAATALAGFMVKQKIDGAAEVQEAASAFLRPISDFDRQIREIEELRIDEQVEHLRETARLRNRPFKSLELLEKTLSALPLDETVIREVVLKQGLSQDAVRAEATLEMNELLAKKLWVSSIRIEKEMWAPETPAEAGATGRRTRRTGPDPVPAFRVRVFAVVVEQGSADASNALIRERLQEPIERALRTTYKAIGKDAGISVSLHQGSLPKIIRSDHDTKGSSVTFQEGGPFFGVELEWRLIDPEHAKRFEAKEASEEEEKDN